mgnify:CR=1 FL=1
MIDKRIDTCLKIIKNKRQTNIFKKDFDIKKDSAWCSAYNHLHHTLGCHKPASRMLEFGVTNFNQSKAYSWKRRIDWVRKYCIRYDVKFSGNGRRSFTLWSKVISYEQKVLDWNNDIGERIKRRMEHERRMFGYSAYSPSRMH